MIKNNGNYELYKIGTFNAASANSAEASVVPFHSNITESSITNIGTRNNVFNDKDGGINDSWGRGINDTHILPSYGPYHLAKKFGGSKAFDLPGVSYNDIGHFDNRYVHKSIGDYEMISGSYKFGKLNLEYSNLDIFKRREIRDKNKGFNHISYTKGDSSLGLIDGRPVGTTAYYITGSNGEMLYPANHWIYLGRSSQYLRHVTYDGTQNTNPGFWPDTRVQDHSTASFYSITVTQDLEMTIIQNNPPGINED